MTRPFSVALLAFLVLPATGAAPSTLRFKISQNFSQTIDATSAGGGVQSLEATFDLYTTVKSTDSAGGRAITVTVDSVVAGTGVDPQIMGMIAGTLKGASGSGAITTDGKVTGFSSGNLQQDAQLKQIARLAFPEMKKGAKAGDSWTDTLSTTDSAAGGGAITRKAITSHTAAAGDAMAGKPTLRVTTATAYTVAGMAQGGVQIEGTGKSNAVLDVTAEGDLAKGQVSDESSLSATPPGSGEALPISNKTSSVITRLP